MITDKIEVKWEEGLPRILWEGFSQKVAVDLKFEG